MYVYNVIRTLYSRRPLDEGREYFLGVLFVILLILSFYLHIILVIYIYIKIYIYTRFSKNLTTSLLSRNCAISFGNGVTRI